MPVSARGGAIPTVCRSVFRLPVGGIHSLAAGTGYSAATIIDRVSRVGRHHALLTYRACADGRLVCPCFRVDATIYLADLIHR